MLNALPLERLHALRLVQERFLFVARAFVGE
jgi:hypothetical protein